MEIYSILPYLPTQEWCISIMGKEIRRYYVSNLSWCEIVMVGLVSVVFVVLSYTQAIFNVTRFDSLSG